MKVSRFFHIRFGTTGGATVKVTGDTEKVGTVDVQTTFCSRKDPFCKKIGRDTAEKKMVLSVPLRYLPAELGRIQATALKKSKADESRYFAKDYTFATKYFLPKE